MRKAHKEKQNKFTCIKCALATLKGTRVMHGMDCAGDFFVSSHKVFVVFVFIEPLMFSEHLPSIEC